MAAVARRRITAETTTAAEPRRLEELFFTVTGSSSANSESPRTVRVVQRGKGAAAVYLVAFEHDDDAERPWQQFLERSVQPAGPFAKEQVLAARLLWREVGRRTNVALPLPAIREATSGSLILLWESPRAIVEVEVLHDGSFEWFWKDREAGAFDGSDDERARSAPQALVDRLQSTFGV